MKTEGDRKRLKGDRFDKLSFSNANSLWGAVAAEVLYRLGLRYAVVSPGSRSTPLTFALARHGGLEAISILDERSASFFALGLAKRNHEPVALVCTSGTAAANFFPALIEARESGVPLLFLTADRPPEMRHCGAEQTIEQQKIYGNYPNFHTELALPEMSKSGLRYLRQTLIHAWTRLQHPLVGPVHLNAPFREPLAPEREGIDRELIFRKLGEDFDPEDFLSHVHPLPKVTATLNPETARACLEEMKRSTRGLILVGPASPEDPEKFAVAVAKTARCLGWPVLADGLGPLRNRAKKIPALICAYDLILRHAGHADRLCPDSLLSIGPLPTSKVLRAWLEPGDVKTWILDPGPDLEDPLHRRAFPLRLSLEAFSEILRERRRKATRFCADWVRLDKDARRKLDGALKSRRSNFEGKAAWLLSKTLPRETPIFIANSMPVRDLEYFWRPGNRRILPFFNRGGNGIDGTLSTALGMAHEGRSAVLLTGDLALLHDTNGFLIHSKFKGHLTIILLNNEGGGIFENLPVSEFEPPFEEFFATPQKVDFKKLAAAYGIDYERVKKVDDIAERVRRLPPSGIRLLEWETDRKRNLKVREEIFREIAESLAI